MPVVRTAEFKLEGGQGSTAAERSWDVVVIGGGNAALVAAISASQFSKSVLLVERAPYSMRGGNSRHTRNIRCAHHKGDSFYTGAYEYDEFWKDLCSVGTGPSNESLAALTVRNSEVMPQWMSEQGINWQTPLNGTLHLGRTNRFFLGGGKALLNAYYRTAQASGVTVVYDACAEDLEVQGNRCSGLIISVAGVRRKIAVKSVICASGGYEANLDWLSRYWGEAARNYIIRGTPYDDGKVLQMLYDQGVDSAGEQQGFHAVAVDARSPRFDGGIATRLDCIPFGIVVNRHARRFYDEGEEVWPKRYAIWGRNIADQDDQIAYAIWDAKVSRAFLPPMYPPVRGDTLGHVAEKLGLPVSDFIAEVTSFNQAIRPGGRFDPSILDGCHTEGLTVSKSNWARPIDTPPYYGIAMRPGITFTYMGVAIDETARVRFRDGSPATNIFAAGEIMSGNILSSGYLAGFGMTIGSVWGRIAGVNAVKYAHDAASR